MSTLRVNAIQNTSGVEQYLAKAWVNFNGTGTVAIRAAGNVSSITDNGTGDYTLNFTNALADANYSALIMGCSQSAAQVRLYMEQHDSQLRSTTQLRIYSLNGSLAVADSGIMSIAIFR